ncbi:MAG: asparagine synthase (glutamine-hydrolyzing) [Phycisphaerales bacterium]|nr:asparagine synthase (glutamine-hydrolyzing) [Phycisphaerales bacterium]
MCGIAGIVHFDAAPVDAERLRAAVQALRHRGPDHLGVWIQRDAPGAVGFAAVRLAVQDPRPQADQPLTALEGKVAIAYNGELYNGDELRWQLQDAGWVFHSTGDTEIALAACATWGEAALARLEGMWALAFFDARRGEGFIARDPVGIKPLLYAAHPQGLCFASELSGLEKLAFCDRRLDPSSVLHHLLLGYIAAPSTIYEGARRLPPGYLLAFTRNGAAAPRAFFNLARQVQDARAELSSMSYGEALTNLRERIARSVVRQRVSDVPLGCFLSGGVDSSIVATHLAEASSRPVETFSIGQAEHAMFDESNYARLVAGRIGAAHHEWRLTQREVIDAIPAVLDHLSEPFGDSSIIPTTLVSRLARRHVTVALSGDGADELFGGYWRYTAHAALRSYQRIPAVLRNGLLLPLLRRAGSAKSSPGANRARQFRKLLRAGGGDALARHLAWARILSPEAERILREPQALRHAEQAVLSTARQLSQPFAPPDDMDSVLAFDVQYGLPGDMLHKVDLASMSCSLEVRVPFLDPQVAAMGLAMPFAWKVDRGLRKRILVDAYRGILPDAVLDRPKQGFEVPFGEYLRGPLRNLFGDVVTAKAVESFAFLRFEGIEQILQDHLNRRSEHGDLLFALLSLCWWSRRTPAPCT